MDNWKVNYMSVIPLHKQLERRIITGIRNGELKCGDCLPSAKGMSRALSLSLATTTRVYRKLLKAGILHHGRGGWYRIVAVPGDSTETTVL